MLSYIEEIKNSLAYSIVKKDVETKRLSHAYLIIGKDKNYLIKYCEEVCKLIISDGSTLSEKNNLRINEHIFPDALFFGERDVIDVETITNIIERADYSPFESDKKVFVLCDFDRANETVQNKILKTIEEPPQNTFFLITATATSKLLQTILSRVKMIELKPISVNNLTKMLEQNNVDKESALVAAICSYGNGELAEKLALDIKFKTLFNDCVQMFDKLEGSKDVLNFSVVFNEKKIDKNELFDIFEIVIHDLLMICSDSENLVLNMHLIDRFKQIAKKFNIKFLLELLQKCSDSKKMLEFNVGSTGVVDEFLFKVAEVKVKCRRLRL